MPEFGKKLGQILLEQGQISEPKLRLALQQQTLHPCPLGELLVSEKTVSHYNIAKALAQQQGLNHAKTPDKPSAFPKLEAGFWLKTGLVPWRFTKGHWQIACANVQDYYKNFRDLHQICGDFSLVLASPTQIRNQTLQLFSSHLLEQAETGLPSHQSCRSLKLKLPYLIALCCVVTGVMLGSELTVILSLFHIFLSVALASLSLSTILKIIIFIGALGQKPASATPSERPQVLPRVTVLIPLLEEPRILHHLLYHLQRLDYPRTHLEVMLILEDGDVETQTALLAAKLPSWCCVITVPKGRVKTKPRALNFALGFSRGDIIGVLDAEDAPEKDQLLKVANQFALADPRLVCLQGRLDFYNAQTNWLTRCFALEYAAWFHVILPGLARLGFALPLGGTSMYIRRSALIDLKGWDAFNVTEDADLGLRLSRAGFRCALLDSKTFEEATKTPLTWIKQRSRWQKGYFMTYWCHNRSPKQLLADLGIWRWIGVHALFFPAIATFLFAPLFWIFWCVAAGLVARQDLALSHGYSNAIGALFALALLADGAIGVMAAEKSGHKGLKCWLPLQLIYFAMATLSAYKAFYSLIVNRFHWAKTAHGDQFSQSWAGLTTPYLDSDFCFKRVTKADDK